MTPLQQAPHLYDIEEAAEDRISRHQDILRILNHPLYLRAGNLQPDVLRVLHYLRILRARNSQPGSQINVIRIPRIKENQQAREKHVLDVLTTLRAVFPGNVTEIIARQILPYTAHAPVPDHLHLKLPVEEQRKIQREKRQVQYDKKVNLIRKHEKPFQRR